MAYMIVLPHCSLQREMLTAKMVMALGEDAEAIKVIELPSGDTLKVAISNSNAPQPVPSPEPERYAPEDLDMTMHEIIAGHGPITSLSLQKLMPGRYRKLSSKTLRGSLKRLAAAGKVTYDGEKRSRLYSAI